MGLILHYKKLKMKEIINICCNRITRPITNNPIFYGISFILLFIPSLVRDYTDVRYWIMAFPISLAWAYVLSFLIDVFRSKALKIILYLILSVVTIIETFVIISFGNFFFNIFYFLTKFLPESYI